MYVPFPWSLQLTVTGPRSFRDTVLRKLGGPESAGQFDALLGECTPLMEAASALPALSLRSDRWAAFTMLRYCSTCNSIVLFRSLVEYNKFFFQYNHLKCSEMVSFITITLHTKNVITDRRNDPT